MLDTSFVILANVSISKLLYKLHPYFFFLLPADASQIHNLYIPLLHITSLVFTLQTQHSLCAFYILYERKICYNKIVAYPNLQRKGGDCMESICSFIISILASVVAYYICKWLDRE